MDCPRCGHKDVASASCPRCGVVFAKLREPRARPPSAPARAEPRGRGVLRLTLEVLVLAGALAAGIWILRNPPAPAAPVAPPPARMPPPTPYEVQPPPRREVTIIDRPPIVLDLPRPSPSALPEDEGIPVDEAKAANALVERLKARQPIATSDLEAAEKLRARYPQQKALKNLVGELLLALALQEQAERRFVQAVVHLRRAASVWPESPRPRLALMNVMLEASDWPGAEAAAREALSLGPRDPDALRGLGFALMRQDRNREAEEALRAALEVGEDTWARELLSRLEKQAMDERGMTERRLSRFNVRYDGDALEDVGREILRALERHYATLARVMDHEIKTAVPVVLFTRDSYYDATGAPAWSGGQFTHFDGRIRIPIGGLTPSLTSDIDTVLIHELTHAFIWDRSGGKAPRDIHEGLAQYMEGKRIASLLSSEQVRALADDRLQGVSAFYWGALSFVEHLMAQRGQGGMNDLLRAMDESGNLDEAFRSVYGRDYPAMREDWRQRFRQQAGS